MLKELKRQKKIERQSESEKMKSRHVHTLHSGARDAPYRMYTFQFRVAVVLKILIKRKHKQTLSAYTLLRSYQESARKSIQQQAAVTANKDGTMCVCAVFAAVVPFSFAIIDDRPQRLRRPHYHQATSTKSTKKDMKM